MGHTGPRAQVSSLIADGAGMAPTTSLVPPRRLGMLLRQARLTAGLGLADLTEISGLSAIALDGVERGTAELGELDVASLMRAYGIEDAGLVPERSQLVIDLADGRIAVNHTDLDVDSTAGPDAILARYLALVYRLRGLPIGAPLELRDVDVAVLSTALEIGSTGVETRLDRLMDDESQVSLDQRRIRRQLLLPVIGVVIAATSIGTLLLVTDAPQVPASPSSLETGTLEISTAVIEEAPDVITDLGSGGAIQENPTN